MIINHKTTNYHPNQRKLTQLFIVGFISTITIFILQIGLYLLGAPAIDLTVGWPGMVTTLLLGVVIFPLFFDYLADKVILPAHRWVKSYLFAFCVWLTIEAIAKPLLGSGIFSTQMQSPIAGMIISLLLVMTYSFMLEAMLRVRIAHELHVPARENTSEKRVA